MTTEQETKSEFKDLKTLELEKEKTLVIKQISNTIKRYAVII